MNIVASSIYLYNNLQEFESFNKDNFNEKFKTIKIIDMYINDKTKLWVVTDTNDLIEKPYLQKSLVQGIHVLLQRNRGRWRLRGIRFKIREIKRTNDKCFNKHITPKR